MQIFEPRVYPLSVLIFLVAAVFLFVFFRVTKYLIQYVRLPERHAVFIRKYLPVSELVAWVLFLLWAVQFLYSRGYVVVFVPILIFIAVILFLSWYGLKDVVAGILFKTANTLQINDQVYIAGIEGKIREIGISSLELEDLSGRLVSIPYSRITGSTIVKQYSSQSLLSHNFSILIPAALFNGDVFELIKKVKLFILTLPWASQKREPLIFPEKESDQQVILNITIFSLDEAYFLKTEKSIEKEFSGKVLIR